MSLHDEQYMHLSWLLVSCDGEDPVGFLLVRVCEQFYVDHVLGFVICMVRRDMHIH